jgi:hypothetical protein
MAQKRLPRKPEPLTAAIISYMKPSAVTRSRPGRRVRCSATRKRVFFCRYQAWFARFSSSRATSA